MNRAQEILDRVSQKQMLESYQVTAIATALGMKYTGGTNEDPEIRGLIDTLRGVATALEAKGL